jgi:hypothetical protein
MSEPSGDGLARSPEAIEYVDGAVGSRMSEPSGDELARSPEAIEVVQGAGPIHLTGQ